MKALKDEKNSRLKAKTTESATPAKAQPRTNASRTFRVAATLLSVPAIVGTIALPSYALLPEDTSKSGSTEYTAALAEAQGVSTSSSITVTSISKDTYSVTTKTEIVAAARAAAALTGNVGTGGAGINGIVGQRAPGDDYPWYGQSSYYLSPLRYYYGECVDFVAWRLNRDAGVTSGPWKWTWATMRGAGDASSWASAWARHGWTTSTEPVVGAVAWFNGNHVAYVQSINSDGSVNIEEYNWGSNHSYNARTIARSGAALYLYPPPA